ncbi:hypothetical protein ADK67_14930 [Saccharothrix sp. NRRL B-16348]|nr:hypothetical protein ADK67_14930 [Saccharothrix sp. NRRL B-16348]
MGFYRAATSPSRFPALVRAGRPAGRSASADRKAETVVTAGPVVELDGGRGAAWPTPTCSY